MKNYNISAIINLAGNQDKLQPLTTHRPIASLPFHSRYRVVDTILSTISYANIESVAMFIAGSGRSIYDHIRSGSEWDLSSNVRGGLFTFSQQYWKRSFLTNENKQHEIYGDHEVFLQRSDDDYLVVMSGEVIHTVNIQDIAAKHVKSNKEITYVVDENGRNMNIFFLSIKLMQTIFKQAAGEKLVYDVIELLNHFLERFETNEYAYDGFVGYIDSINDFFFGNLSLLDPENYDKLFNSEVPIITRARSNPPAYYGKEANVRNSTVATGSRICSNVENSMIFRKVNIDEYSKISNSILMTGCDIGKNVTLDYVLLDKNVTIEDNVVLRGSKENIIIVPKNSVVKAW